MKHAELHESLVAGDILLFDPSLIKKKIIFTDEYLTEFTEFRFLGFQSCGGTKSCVGCKGFMKLERIDNGAVAEKCWRWSGNTILSKYQDFIEVSEMEI